MILVVKKINLIKGKIYDKLRLFNFFYANLWGGYFL